LPAASLTNVFVFTAKRAEVARFFEEVLGLTPEPAHDDSVWFEQDGGARLTVHDREDGSDGQGFVPWFHVPDLAATFERARTRGGVIGDLRDGYFLARDPDGRVFGVRQWR
jgi:predicted enzyme related to lactoylglutathione lyase